LSLVGLDHLLFVVLAVLFPIRASTFGYRRLTTAPLERVTDVRHSLYRQAILIQWALAASVVLLWILTRRSWKVLGLAPRGWIGPVIGLALVIVIAFALAQVRARARRDPEILERYRDKLRHLERMLPHTPGELRAFHVVSWTAGICEELLYRGYLLWYLGHWMGMPAVAVSSLLFGIGHSYQGWRGIVTTTLVGVVMALIYLGAGSLWPAMALHALIDIHSGSIAYSALTAPVPEPEATEAVAPSAEAPSAEAPPSV
jgi:membrane protease YdiL (CAAX protease family)